MFQLNTIQPPYVIYFMMNDAFLPKTEEPITIGL